LLSKQSRYSETVVDSLSKMNRCMVYCRYSLLLALSTFFEFVFPHGNREALNLIHGKVPLVLLKIISSRKPANTLATVAYHVSLSLATVVHGLAWWKKSCLKFVSIGKMRLIRPRRQKGCLLRDVFRG